MWSWWFFSKAKAWQAHTLSQCEVSLWNHPSSSSLQLLCLICGGLCVRKSLGPLSNVWGAGSKRLIYCFCRGRPVVCSLKSLFLQLGRRWELVRGGIQMWTGILGQLLRRKAWDFAGSKQKWLRNTVCLFHPIGKRVSRRLTWRQQVANLVESRLLGKNSAGTG